ncbi:MAG TPA: DUF2239 family protein [Xanthobacteraceae bacterium]|nr:DUF2239 family protein [Xanthobacteraceae bacterium]
MSQHSNIVAFAGEHCIAAGDLARVARAARKFAAAGGHKPILAFDAATGEQIDLDLRGTDEHQPPKRSSSAAHGRAQEEPRGPGRPKLGVIAREVTLLPRHWDWLASQPGGASVALRKLVQHGMRANAGKDRIRASQNAAYQFMSAMAGNRAGFEEAARALFAGDARSFNRRVDAWPKDVRDLVKKLAAVALQTETTAA